MIEKIVLDYLNNVLQTPSYIELPEVYPAKHILIEKTGSSEENHINSATIAIKSHAESLYEAALLNEDVKEKMNEIIKLASISEVKLNTDYNFTDTVKKKYRYQAVYDLVY